jgi:hypothetical protein
LTAERASQHAPPAPRNRLPRRSYGRGSIVAKSKEQQRRELNARIVHLQEKEASSPHASLERQQAVDERVQLESALYALDHTEEETVTLLAPNPATSGADGALGVDWDRGKAEVPRSVAGRLVAEYPEYGIEEAT